MKYEFSYFSEEHDYWLGIDPESKRHLLGIPVSNPMADHIETAAFVKQEALATQFADACRRREHDGLLTHKPGKRRGTPR